MGKQEASRAPNPIPSFPQPLTQSRTTRAASRAQISSSSLLWKRPRTLDVDDAPTSFLLGCSGYAETPSRLLKPKTLRGPCSVAQIHFPSWGSKKRARTARRPTNRKDWANLGDGPAGLIAELVLAADVADYIRFRTVCRPWRRCSADPRARGVLDRRFHPRGWIILREKRADPQSRQRFLNVRTGGSFRSSSTTACFSPPPRLLRCRATNVICLLNPLTRQVAELPQIPTNLASEFRGAGAPDNAGLAGDHTVVLYSCTMETLAFAKPGDEHWVLLKFAQLLMPTMSFAGRFYGVTTDAVMVVDTRENLPPRLVVAAKLGKPFRRMVDTVHLVDIGGELMLVHRKIRKIRDVEDCFKRKYKVHRVDLDAGKTAPVHGLSGHAVFIGCYRTLSVSPQVFPNVRADTVYPGLDMDERTGDAQIGAYHLKDGSIEPSNIYDRWSGLIHPLNAAEFLADCVRLV